MSKLHVLVLMTTSLSVLAQRTPEPRNEDNSTASSVGDRLRSFADRYCAGGDESLEKQLSTALRCQESEALPGMPKVLRSCWQSAAGTNYPSKTEEWKKFICEDDDFIKKNEKITECFQQQIGPQEEAIFVKNMNACIKMRN